MGSYCSLYIGDTEFSWKSVVPDPICVLFEPKDYAFPDRDYEYDGEMWGGPEHLFVSTCGATRARLEKIGVSIGKAGYWVERSPSSRAPVSARSSRTASVNSG